MNDLKAPIAAVLGGCIALVLFLVLSASPTADAQDDSPRAPTPFPEAHVDSEPTEKPEPPPAAAKPLLSKSEAPPTPDELGLVPPQVSKAVREETDAELLSRQTGVAVAEIEANEKRYREFLDAIEALPDRTRSQIALIEVPDIVTGADGTVQFVGSVPANSIPWVEAKVGALIDLDAQEALLNDAVERLTDAGVQIQRAAASPFGLDLQLSEDEKLSDDAIRALTRLPSELEIEVTRGNLQLVPTTTSIGGSHLYAPVSNCTSGFAIGFPAGGASQQKMATAGHCFTAVTGQYAWEWNAIINQFHLYRTTVATVGSSGDLAIMDPVSQAQLDSWYGLGAFQQADPEPWFISNFNTATQRPLLATEDPYVNQWVCTSGVSNIIRFCEQVFAINQWTNTGATGNPFSANINVAGLAFTTTDLQVLVRGTSGAPYTYNNTGMGIAHAFGTLPFPIGGQPAGTVFNAFQDHDYLWYLDNAVLCTLGNNLCLGVAS